MERSGEESPRLRFDSHQDALDHVRNLVERQERRDIVYAMSFCERYVNLGMHIVLRCEISGTGSVYDLVLCGVPGTVQNELHRSSKNQGATFHYDVPQGRNVRAYDGVFVDVGGISECPEKWKAVPSLVGIERPKERHDIWMQVLTPPFNAVTNILRSRSDWEVGARARTGYAGCPSRSGASMVESATEILESVGSDIGELSEVETGNNYLELFQAGVRVYLDNVGVFVSLNESIPLPYQITDVLLCSI